MATLIPTIKAKMGNTEYFLIKMTAGELVSRVRPAMELDDWARMSIEDRMQRDPDLKRIKRDIAPYLASTEDRFFGALIVLVYKGDVYFEGLGDLKVDLHRAYQSAAKDIGFVTIDGGSLIALDGQHRLLALEKVVKNDIGTNEDGSEYPYSTDVPNDEVSVILIKHETNEKTRRIFNKTNRYAKPTSRGDNIITSEDDGYAIVARRMVESEGAFASVPVKQNDGSDGIPREIVNWKSNTLADRSTHLTTISIVYESAKLIHAFNGHERFDQKMRPQEVPLSKCFTEVNKFWKEILAGMKQYNEALLDPTKIPAMRGAKGNPGSLLFKPAGQLALVKGIIKAIEEDSKKTLTLEEAVRRADLIDWFIEAEHWKDIIIRQNGTIDPRAEAVQRAGNLIAVMIGGKQLDPEVTESIRKEWATARRASDGSQMPKGVLD